MVALHILTRQSIIYAVSDMALEYGEDGIHIHVDEVRYQYLISQVHWHIESVYIGSHKSVREP